MAEHSSSSFDQDPNAEGVPHPEEPQESKAQSGEEYAQGNRPAEGAQMATPGSVFDQDWKGQPGATDFLGLDQELAPEEVPYDNAAPAMAPLHEVAEEEPTAASEELPLEPQTSHENMQSSSWFMDGGDDTAVVEDGQREGYASSTEEHGAAHDLGLDDVDESWFEEEPRAGGLRRKLIAVGGVVLLGVGGTFATMTFMSKDSGSGETIVARPNGPAGPSGAVEPRTDPKPPGELARPGENAGGRAAVGRGGKTIPAPTAPQETQPTPRGRPVALVPQSEPGGEDPVASSEPTESVSNPLQGGPTPTPDPVASGPDLADPFGPKPQGGEPAAGPSTAPPDLRPTSPQLAGVDQRSTLIQPEDLVIDGRDLGGVRIASADDLGAIWPNETVPEELIRGSRKVLTPAVGRVRVILETDEIFEGALYALGRNTVWVESIHGRMGLDNDRIARIDRIATSATSPVLGDTGSEAMTGLDRVCIKAEGGTFFGKVISKGDEKTIVITDGGARLTLLNSEVDLIVGKNPQVVVKF